MSNETVQVIEPGGAIPIVDGDGEARVVIWPGMGANLRSMHRISLGRAARTVELAHPSEAVYYVMDGAGSVLEQGGASQPLRRGSMFLVEPGTHYRIEADGTGIELVGGPCPPDPALYKSLT